MLNEWVTMTTRKEEDPQPNFRYCYYACMCLEWLMKF